MRRLVLCLLAVAPAASPGGAVDFDRDVRPILAARCLDCHGPKKQKGGLRLDQPEGIQRTKSEILPRVTGDEGRMPPSGPRLTAKQIDLLRAWVADGAKMPGAATHWAYRPLSRPAVPAAAGGNPIDAFVQARLDAARLRPAPPADRRSLLRRLHFDLLGLPPTPQEVEAFLHDTRPGAYERVVDRLLASPAYGERYARHWLDVVHFAETHGHDQDVPRENAWPYRDYLIRAFNDDRPWSRMIQEQVAGDVLYPDSPDGIVATGMLAAGPWDESSQQSIRDDSLDKKQAQNLDRDDVVTTVFSAFASTTVHCARCHDHKFDPVSQAEYYGLQAVFAGIDKANRPYDPDPSVARKRRAFQARLKEVESAGPKSLLTAANERRAAAWEKARGAEVWRPLEPATVTTANGSAFTKLPDRSVRFGGPRPERDTYTITTTAPPSVTAVRLDLLTDVALPHKGPGRQDNGNLHLNEFRVEADGKPVTVRSAVADFDQAGWDVSRAIDGQPATAWGIYPAVGKPHHAVFVFAQPVSATSGLTFTLEQTHGGGHLIGRLRLSVTSATSPTTITPVPAAVATVLGIDPEKRSPAQKADLVRHVLLEEARAELAALSPPRMVFAAASDFEPVSSFKPAKGCRPVSVLRRGEITKPLAPAAPGALSFLPELPSKLAIDRPDDEGARRAALARWLADRRNALTWRSMANRVWHYHFGKGLASPGDLGKMGTPPSHPDLLDWLAAELRDTGSLKSLHRLIVTSDAYRRAVRHDPEAAKVDADNALLWRGNRQRLDAESLRDAVLAVSGKLDRAMGGPSARQFVLSKGIHVTPNVDYAGLDVDAPGMHRRAVYRFVFRTLPDPLLDALDCPDASQFTPARSSSITALQALALLNDRFMVRQAEHFAERLRREAGEGTERCIRLAYELALSRAATDREVAALADYARKHGLAAACRVLLNCNEFVFVD